MFKVSFVPTLKPGIVTEVVETPSLAHYVSTLPRPTLDDKGAKRDDAPLIVMGSCDIGKIASDDTWRGSNIVMLDIDGKAEGPGAVPSFEDTVAQARQLGFGFIAGPSRRDGLAGGRRYRFIFYLDTEAKSVRVYAETAKWLAQSIGVIPDSRSFVPSQRWYGFTATVDHPGPGAPLQFAALNRAPIPEEISAPLRGAAEGERRTTLYARAYQTGTLARILSFDAAGAINELVAASRAVGLDEDDFERHLRRGFEAGFDDPRNALIHRPNAKTDPEGAQRWDASLRTALEMGVLLVEHPGGGRVLYERLGSARRVAAQPSKEGAESLLRRVAEASGLALPQPAAEAKVRDLLSSAYASHDVPVLFDPGDGRTLYRFDQPRREAGPTPTWDKFLGRLSDPDAFLAHVHAVFEPRWQGRQVLWLQGAGNDGKSIAVQAIAQAAFGINNIAVLDDGALGRNNQFTMSTLWDKPLVLIPDTKNVNLVMTGLVHRLVGRDILPVEYKHRHPFNAKFLGAVWVTSNPMPSIEDSASNTTRLTILTIEPLKEFIPDITNKYIEEMPGLLAKAADSYRERVGDEHFRIRLNAAAEAAVRGATSDVEDKYAVWAEKAGLEIGEGLGPKEGIKSTDVYGALDTAHIRVAPSERAGFYEYLKRRGARIENRADGYKRIFNVKRAGY
jgi:hypothetical protein